MAELNCWLEALRDVAEGNSRVLRPSLPPLETLSGLQLPPDEEA